MTTTDPLPADSRPLTDDQIDPIQRQALERVEQLLWAMSEAAPAAPTGPLVGMPIARPDRARSPRIILIDGARGTGKTSVMLTLLDRWARQREGSSPDGEGAWPNRHLWPRILALPPADFDPLPPKLPLIGWLLQHLEPLVEWAEQGSKGHGCSPRSALEGWRALIDMAVTAWAEPAVGAPDEERRRGRAEARFTAQLGAAVDALCAQLEAKVEGWSTKGLIVLPIDDVDLQLARVADLANLLRAMHHPRLVFLVNGDARLLKFVAQSRREGEVRRLRGPVMHADDLPAGSAAYQHLGADLVDKVFRPALRVGLPLLKWEDALALEGGRLRRALAAGLPEGAASPVAPLAGLDLAALEHAMTYRQWGDLAAWPWSAERCKRLDELMGLLWHVLPARSAAGPEAEELREQWGEPVPFAALLGRLMRMGARLEWAAVGPRFFTIDLTDDDARGACLSLVASRLQLVGGSPPAAQLAHLNAWATQREGGLGAAERGSPRSLVFADWADGAKPWPMGAGLKAQLASSPPGTGVKASQVREVVAALHAWVEGRAPGTEERHFDSVHHLRDAAALAHAWTLHEGLPEAEATAQARAFQRAGPQESLEMLTRRFQAPELAPLAALVHPALGLPREARSAIALGLLTPTEDAGDEGGAQLVAALQAADATPAEAGGSPWVNRAALRPAPLEQLKRGTDDPAGWLSALAGWAWDGWLNGGGAEGRSEPKVDLLPGVFSPIDPLRIQTNINQRDGQARQVKLAPVAIVTARLRRMAADASAGRLSRGDWEAEASFWLDRGPFTAATYINRVWRHLCGDDERRSWLVLEPTGLLRFTFPSQHELHSTELLEADEVEHATACSFTGWTVVGPERPPHAVEEGELLIGAWAGLMDLYGFSQEPFRQTTVRIGGTSSGPRALLTWRGQEVPMPPFVTAWHAEVFRALWHTYLESVEKIVRARSSQSELGVRRLVQYMAIGNAVLRMRRGRLLGVNIDPVVPTHTLAAVPDIGGAGLDIYWQTDHPAASARRSNGLRERLMQEVADWERAMARLVAQANPLLLPEQLLSLLNN